MLRESDKRVVRAFVNEKPASSNLLETDGVRLDKIGLGGETVARWIDGRIAIVSTESVKSDESIIRLIMSVAGPGVVDFSYARKGHRVHEHGAMGRNGRMDPRTGARVPSPRFHAGERVVRDDGSARGEVAIVGNYDDTIGGYRYKVQQDDGARIYWNEPSTRHEGHKPNGIDWERSAVVEDIERDFSGTSMAGEHPDTEVHIEHGQPWVICLCGASWSVIDTNRGLDYERIDEGDDAYHLEPNGRATTVDPVAARELDLYIANTYELVAAPNSIGKSIDANLKRKLANGSYDSALAPKAWQYLVDEGAKRYQKEFGSDSPIFNAATRRQVAADFARAWEDENGMRANGVTNETNLRQAIMDALHQRSRKHLEIWRTVSQRYPSTVYADFDALMGRMEMDGTITLTGSRGPNTYKLA